MPRGISAGTASQRTSFGSVQMDMSKQYYVYIMTNRSGTLYIGVTGDLLRRVHQHKTKRVSGFTAKYNLTLLVYYETGSDIREAIAREKQLKGWRRSKKLALIRSSNPKWNDLSDGWFATEREEILGLRPRDDRSSGISAGILSAGEGEG